MPFTMADPAFVSARSFEDEIVVAHFGTGVYYSLLDSAAEVWRGLLASFEVSEVIAKLAPRSIDGPADFSASVERFVVDLRDAGLIQPAEGRIRDPWEPVPPAKGWSRPQVESFSDMQELLLLDPVHDTSEAGWPYVVKG